MVNGLYVIYYGVCFVCGTMVTTVHVHTCVLLSHLCTTVNYCTHLCTTVTPVYYCKLLYTPRPRCGTGAGSVHGARQRVKRRCWSGRGSLLHHLSHQPPNLTQVSHATSAPTCCCHRHCCCYCGGLGSCWGIGAAHSIWMLVRVFEAVARARSGTCTPVHVYR